MHKNNRLKESISAFFSAGTLTTAFGESARQPLPGAGGFSAAQMTVAGLIFVFSVTGELNHIPALGAGAEHAQNALGVGCELPKGEGDRTFKTHGLFTEVPGGS